MGTTYSLIHPIRYLISVNDVSEYNVLSVKEGRKM